MGFQAPSTTLIRGVDRYMVDLESALENLEVTRYEFLDFEVDVHIDVALVYYVARDLLSNPRGEKTILVRVLDLYGLQPTDGLRSVRTFVSSPTTTNQTDRVQTRPISVHMPLPANSSFAAA